MMPLLVLIAFASLREVHLANQRATLPEKQIATKSFFTTMIYFV